MSMLDGVSQCWWLSSSCVANWDAWATVVGGLVGIATTVVAVLAWKTSRRAAEIADHAVDIAKQQHQETLDMQRGEARIIGRLVIAEVTAMPPRVAGVWRDLDKSIEWDEGNQISSVSGLRNALLEASQSFLPGAEEVEARIHNLPDALGDDLASLIGWNRTLNHLAARLDARLQTSVQPVTGLRFSSYNGSRTDFDTLRAHLELCWTGSVEVAHEFQNFVGIPATEYGELENPAHHE